MSRHYETLQLERERDWLTVWFNRPESRNALSAPMQGELLELLQSIAPDRSIRGVTLRGRGGVFCAGGDLKGFKASFQSGPADLSEVARSSRKGGELYDRINTLPQVVVALVEGAAMAGGMGIVCCADVVIVSSNAKFALTETTLGIPPAQIAPFIAERLGLRTARRLMLTAARFTGSEALSVGLADFVADDLTGLTDIEDRIRKQVRECAPGANETTKDILLTARHLDREAMLDYAAMAFARCMLGEEAREGIAAFVQKRKPSWAVTPAIEPAP